MRMHAAQQGPPADDLEVAEQLPITRFLRQVLVTPLGQRMRTGRDQRQVMAARDLGRTHAVADHRIGERADAVADRRDQLDLRLQQLVADERIEFAFQLAQECVRHPRRNRAGARMREEELFLDAKGVSVFAHWAAPCPRPGLIMIPIGGQGNMPLVKPALLR